MKIFYFFILLSCSIYASAQDKNILAKIAFEDAETAYAAGNVQDADKELNKVDILLGNLTPKSQYLRVQIWILAVEQNPSNIDGAIENCKLYLDLSKSFDIPEEKVMDVTRTIVKLQKSKEAISQKKKDEESALSLAKEREKEREKTLRKRFDEFSYRNWPLHISLIELKNANTDSLLFRSRPKIVSPNKALYTKHSQSGISYNEYNTAIPENYFEGNVHAAFTNKEGKVIAYEKVIYHKSDKKKDVGLESSRAEVLNMISKQNHLLGQASITGQIPGQTTGTYTWKFEGKSINWYVYLTPGTQWTATIVEELFFPL